MKSFVLDTHSLCWHLSAPKKVGRSARTWLRQMDRGKAVAIVSAATLMELALLREGQRNVLGPAELATVFDSHPGFAVQPITRAIAEEFAGLASLVDPFDRMIVATARVLDVPLLTADERITLSRLVEVVWD